MSREETLHHVPDLHLRLDHYSFSVLDVCQELHGDCCGSGHPISEDRRLILMEWLENRLTFWGSCPGNPPYDHAVRALVQAALEESTRYATFRENLKCARNHTGVYQDSHLDDQGDEEIGT